MGMPLSLDSSNSPSFFWLLFLFLSAAFLLLSSNTFLLVSNQYSSSEATRLFCGTLLNRLRRCCSKGLIFWLTRASLMRTSIKRLLSLSASSSLFLLLAPRLLYTLQTWSQHCTQVWSRVSSSSLLPHTFSPKAKYWKLAVSSTATHILLQGSAGSRVFQLLTSSAQAASALTALPASRSMSFSLALAPPASALPSSFHSIASASMLWNISSKNSSGKSSLSFWPAKLRLNWRRVILGRAPLARRVLGLCRSVLSMIIANATMNAESTVLNTPGFCSQKRVQKASSSLSIFCASPGSRKLPSHRYKRRAISKEHPLKSKKRRKAFLSSTYCGLPMNLSSIVASQSPISAGSSSWWQR
mmetsp:Transcript_12287/g.23547  ORF Transcript_12287/g.23547 Transcript_12287/m.23547 type:complete len:357 (-) Transcript_12287:526-1596(-)